MSDSFLSFKFFKIINNVRFLNIINIFEDVDILGYAPKRWKETFSKLLNLL